jgi:hypothetical protein
MTEYAAEQEESQIMHSTIKSPRLKSGLSTDRIANTINKEISQNIH